ncbi:MAG: tetratricopeptide repeat protein [Alphaproteobacteria bacterium]|nr:tetratricopeptide repeat protein [Alphaproteobacteria bacterium]
MMSGTLTDTLTVQEWLADYRACRLTRSGETRKVEPKVIGLLFLLAREPGRVFSRDEILHALWPGVTVDADTLSRCVFKLRRALDDNPEAPRFIETVSRRGYRLMAAAGDREADILKRRADEHYFQFTQSENEAAIILYERALARNGRDTVALAGLANAFAQRAIRWLNLKPGDAPRRTMQEALESGVFVSPEGGKVLNEAHALCDRALSIEPESAQALKAMGLVLTALGRFADARQCYETALKCDPDAWGVLINLADIEGMEGFAAKALDLLERAFEIMSADYDRQSALIRPWHAALGALIADRYRQAGDKEGARRWYRRVLEHSPLHEDALRGLAEIPDVPER